MIEVAIEVMVHEYSCELVSFASVADLASFLTRPLAGARAVWCLLCGKSQFQNNVANF